MIEQSSFAECTLSAPEWWSELFSFLLCFYVVKIQTLKSTEVLDVDLPAMNLTFGVTSCIAGDLGKCWGRRTFRWSSALKIVLRSSGWGRGSHVCLSLPRGWRVTHFARSTNKRRVKWTARMQRVEVIFQRRADVLADKLLGSTAKKPPNHLLTVVLFLKKWCNSCKYIHIYKFPKSPPPSRTHKMSFPCQCFYFYFFFFHTWYMQRLVLFLKNTVI